MDLAKKTKVNALFDCYGALLTTKQAEYLRDYFEGDYSIIEIAKAENVSRQAISDNLKRTVEQLEHYEQALHLYCDFQSRQGLEADLAEYVQQHYQQDRQLTLLVERLRNQEIN